MEYKMKAQMFNHRGWISDVSEHQTSFDPHYIRNTFDDILNNSGFKVLSFVEHLFDPHGYTALWLLSESHLAIHTFPEENTFYVEMSSCVYEPFLKYVDIMHNSFQGRLIRC